MKIAFKIFVFLFLLCIAHISLADNINSPQKRLEKQSKGFLSTSDSKRFSQWSKNGHSKPDIKDIFKHILKSTSKLELNESQVDEIKKISYNFKKDYISLDAEIKILKIELEEIFETEPFNFKEAEAFSQDISTLVSKANNLKAYALIDTLKLLTPKQRKYINKKHNFDFNYLKYLW